VNFRAQFFQNQTTVEYLGQASKKIYSFVRQDLGVPFHRGLVEQPTPGDTMLDRRPKKTIGSWVRIIYESLRDGRLYEKLMDALAEGLVEVKTEDCNSDGWKNGVRNGTHGHA
jgi:phenylalanine ammonia-lyase